jgi:enoyl-CoA hydratase
MALLGRRISAERAHSLGFVSETSEDPCALAFDIATKSMSQSRRATEVAKYMIQAALSEDRATMIEVLGAGMIAAVADRAEGVAAFRAKRKPEFPEV